MPDDDNADYSGGDESGSLRFEVLSIRNISKPGGFRPGEIMPEELCREGNGCL